MPEVREIRSDLDQDSAPDPKTASDTPRLLKGPLKMTFSVILPDGMDLDGKHLVQRIIQAGIEKVLAAKPGRPRSRYLDKIERMRNAGTSWPKIFRLLEVDDPAQQRRDRNAITARKRMRRQKSKSLQNTANL